MLAEKKATPMLVVMPLCHVVPFFGQPYDYAGNTKEFQDYLLKEVVPVVDAKYRTAPGPENRAIAGLSMGGALALYIGLGNLDLFRSIGVFSAAGGADRPGTPSALERAGIPGLSSSGA